MNVSYLVSILRDVLIPTAYESLGYAENDLFSQVPLQNPRALWHLCCLSGLILNYLSPDKCEAAATRVALRLQVAAPSTAPWERPAIALPTQQGENGLCGTARRQRERCGLRGTGTHVHGKEFQ
jgi:hypothetical protein